MKKIILFGAGDRGRKALRILGREKVAFFATIISRAA